VGVRDVILPGDMKDLLNKVMGARKAAEANLIARREETAAMRSQANTAKLLEANSTLMRLRKLEVLEKIA
jgi:regulator of protease activity HflC (stomatin/prohibitin superfamily)